MMRHALSFAVVCLLSVSWLCVPTARVTAEPTPQPPDQEVKLPAAHNAKAPDKSVVYVHFLNVNDKGQVLLALNSPGNAVGTLDNPVQVELFLKRCVKEEQTAGQPLQTVIGLRVDARTPFAKTYCILKASRSAGYRKFQWRVNRGADGEGQIPFASGNRDEKTIQFTARVTTQHQTHPTQITLRGPGIEKELDLKVDVDAFAKKLAELVVKHKGQRVTLALEVAEQLLQGELIKLIDAAVGAGVTDTSPYPIDPKKR